MGVKETEVPAFQRGQSILPDSTFLGLDFGFLGN